MATLKVTSGATAGAKLELDRAIVVGRENCDLILPDTDVSRQHVRLTPVEDGVLLEDLGSLNGTFVDGQRIEGSVKAATTSSLRLGRTELALELPAPPPPAPAMGELAPKMQVTRAREVVPEPAPGEKPPAQPDLTKPRDVVPGPPPPPQPPAQPDLTKPRDVVPGPPPPQPPAQPDLTKPRDVVPGPPPQQPPADSDMTAVRAVPQQPPPQAAPAPSHGAARSGLLGLAPPLLVAIGVGVVVALVVLLVLLG